MKSTFQESTKTQTYWILTIAIILAGAGIRLFGLAALPMTELEAANANAALAFVRAGFSARTSEPFYVFLTSVIFKLFSDQPFTARLIPALFGTALIFLPIAFRNHFSSRTILIWTLLLALDPSLIAWSKRADGVMIAVCVAAYLIAALRSRSTTAVTFLSAALIASPLRSLPMIIAAAATAALLGFLNSLFFDGNFRPINRIREIFNGKIIIASCVLALVFATAFFANPSGLGSLGTGIVNAFSETPILVPPSVWLILGLTFYGFQSILAIGCRIEGSRSRSTLKILLPTGALIFALIAVLFNQGVLAFVWIAPLLTLCAAIAADSILDRSSRPYEFIEKIYFFVPVAYLLIIYLTLSTFNRYANQGASLTTPVTIGELTLPISQAQQFFLLALIILAAVYFLIPMVAAYFGAANLGRAGAAGILLAALIIAAGNAWDAAGFRHGADAPTSDKAVLIQPLLGNQTYFEAAVLSPELSALSAKTKRDGNEAAGMIVQQDDAALRWTLRDYPNAIFSPFPIRETAAQLDFYLTADQPAELVSAYSGMEIVASRSIHYDSLNDLHWMKWLLYRNIPTQEKRLILWQRNNALYSK